MLPRQVNRGITHLLAMYQPIQGELIIQLLNNLLGRILQGKCGLTKPHFTGAPKTLGEEGIDLLQARQRVKAHQNTRLSMSTVKTHLGVPICIAIVVD